MSGMERRSFSREFKLKVIERLTIQALLGEALDHLMRARGKHPLWGALRHRHCVNTSTC